MLNRPNTVASVSAPMSGATLWHEGQFEGRRVRPPVFLSRRPDEPPDEDLHSFYRRLLAAVRSADLRSGQWRLLDCASWPDNPTHRNLLAWCWTDGNRRHLAVINLSDYPAQGHVPLPWAELRGRRWRLPELLADTIYERDGNELVEPGLFVGLDGWRWHLVSLEQ